MPNPAYLALYLYFIVYLMNKYCLNQLEALPIMMETVDYTTSKICVTNHLFSF